MRTDAALCPAHQANFIPNDCYACVLAELAWIGQREQALTEHGYDPKEAHRIASTWAKCRRFDRPFPIDAGQARQLAKSTRT